MASEYSMRNRAWILLGYVLLVLSAKTVMGVAIPGNLWDVGPPLTDQQQDFTGLELGAITPGQLATFEDNKRYGIFNDTLQLAKSMKACQAMVVAAYRLSSYVPHIQANQSEFWDGTVIKIVVQTLNQDVLARSLISKCFGRIRDLSIVIQNVYTIVKLLNGSKKSVELAQRNVPPALDKITDCIQSVETLDSNVVTAFAGNTNTFISIIGSEAAHFSAEKLQWDIQIQEARDIQQDLVTELGIRKGEVERYFYLIKMTEAYLGQTAEESQEAKQREGELSRLISEVQNAILNIPETVEQTVTISEGISVGPFSVTLRKSRPVQVPNPNKASQERLYTDVMNQRVARLLTVETDEEAKKQAIAQLQSELVGYTADFTRATSDLQYFQKKFDTYYYSAEAAVNRALEAKRNIDSRADEIYQMIGLEGSTLIEALEHVEVFAQSLNPAATAYSPFAAILNTIKVLVETHVQLLSSDDPFDVFLAAALLIEQAQFLLDYVVGAQQILNPNDDYDGKAIIQQPNQLLLA